MIKLGNTTIEKVHEMDLGGFTLTQLMPAMNLHAPEIHPEWFPDGTVRGNRAVLSSHSWLVRHEGMTILVDTGAGNGKARPQQMVPDHLQNPFLESLALANASTETINYVLHTHLHSDHVGWNTRLVGGEWQPTFPNAITICSRLEWNYGAALMKGDQDGIAAVAGSHL